MKTKTVFAVLGAWLGLALSSSSADSAAGGVPGAVAGRISNQATRVYLEGASVTLQPGGQTALTGRDGAFEFPTIPPGGHSLTVAHAGLDAQTVAVTVEPGRRTIRDIAPTSGIYVLEALMVSGEREGNAQAIQVQRYAPNVKNVLSSDAFGNVADENIGNLLLRVPGVTGEVLEGQVTYIKLRGVASYMNSVTVDGTRGGNGGTRSGLNRSVEIDTIPAGFIDKIEVTKAPTPDMDADSMGGSVNLKTKSALNQKGRILSHNTGATYGTGRKTLRPQGNFMYSELLGKEQRLGLMVNGNYSWARNPRDVIFGTWAQTLEIDRPAWFALTSAREDYFEHKRGGLGARFDYRLSENATIYLNLMGSDYYDRMDRRRNTFTAPGAANILPGFTQLVTETRNTSYGMNHQFRRRWVRTYNAHLGGEYKRAGMKLDYNFNFSPSSGRSLVTSVAPSVAGVGFRFDRKATIDRPAGATFVQISGPDITNPANMTLPSVGFTDDRKDDQIVGGQMNFRRAIELPGTTTCVQAGLRFRLQTPKAISSPSTYNYVGPGGAALGRFLDGYYTDQPDALRGTMPGVRFFHVPTVVYEWENRPEYFTINRVTTLRNTLTSNRNATEGVYVAYAMGNVQMGRLGILGGLRAEETRVEGTGSIQFISPEERVRRAAWVGTVTETENLRCTQAEYGNRVTNQSDYRNLFPGLHLRYEFSRRLLGRLSYSTGIGRPNFGTIIPNDSVNDQTQVVTANNPSLKPQRGDNFDATMEYYFEPAGLRSVGLFQKDISDFIFSTDTAIIGTGTENGFKGEYAGYRLVTQANGGFAKIRGLELNYQQQFSNLPGFWRGFGVYANCTWLETRGDYGTIGTSRSSGQVPGFVPRSGNIGISYIDRGWTARRIQHTHYSRVMGGSISANLSQQQYNYGRKKVDLSLSYALDPRLTVYADVTNIFGDTFNSGGSPYSLHSGAETRRGRVPG